MLHDIECMFSELAWDQKKTGIKASLLQLKKDGIGPQMPHVTLYYLAALLENVVQWWNPLTKQSWETEQLGTSYPRVEWVSSMYFSQL